MNGVCCLCGVRKKLCKAHIIPEAFYSFKETGALRKVTISDFPKRLQIGEYDSTILCADCDNLFSSYENYAKQVLCDTFLNQFKKETQNGTIYIVHKGSFNYKKLRVFFLSLLWKASVSKTDACADVVLGRYEKLLYKILTNQIEDDNKLFKISVCKYKNQCFKGLTYINKYRLCNNMSYLFVFNGFIVSITPNFWNILSGSNVLENLFLSEDCLIIVEVDDYHAGVLNHVIDIFKRHSSFINSIRKK